MNNDTQYEDESIRMREAKWTNGLFAIYQMDRMYNTY